mmetsp:Transcript_36549/g.70142  ORF Transcript_36549/g.70142 Transcript_36549/m.70142 type:complete len:175 (-) Transcript_36549:188-712(-)
MTESLDELRLMFRTPHATHRALKAVLYMLGKSADTFDTWTKCRTHCNIALFGELQAFDATADRVMPHWKGVRACMKDLKAEALQSEAIIGDLLRIYVLHTKKVAKACWAQREAEASLKTAEEQCKLDQAAVDEVQKILDEALEREKLANPEPEEGEGGEGEEEGEGGEEEEADE